MILPHARSPVLTRGTKLEQASAVVLLLHGRGATAEDILSLSSQLDFPGVLFVAPQAEGYTWYPNRFIAPIESNEPHLSAALKKIDDILKQVEEQHIASQKIFLGGFSQGACLAAEYVIRNPRPYGGLIVFSGGYIGPLGEKRELAGTLHGMPAFLGCSDPDPHIPLQRVHETAALLNQMGAVVTTRIYPNMGHTIIDEEIELARTLIEKQLA
jgi:predicted esterase